MILNLDTFNKMLTHLKRIMILDTLLLLSKASPSHKVEAKSEVAYTIVQATSHTEIIKK